MKHLNQAHHERERRKMLIDKAYYTTLYGDIDEALFNRLEYDAERMLQDITTGVDGVCKIKEYFPIDDNAEALKRAIAKIVYTLKENETKSKVVTLENGQITSNIVNSVSSGSESMSFDNSALKTNALTSIVDVKTMAREEIRGIKDLNGINMLYMGEYPDV